MTKAKKTTVSITAITTQEPKKLAEFDGWKEKQINLVRDNPLIEVKDHKTYTEAKKRRTALKTGRTELQKQDREIAKQLAAFRKKVGGATDELIEITLKAETAQQSEIDRYEEQKRKEKEEEERKEKERLDKIIKTYYEQKNKFELIRKDMRLDTVDEDQQTLDDFLESLPPELYEHPDLNISKFVHDRIESFNAQVDVLQDREARRKKEEELKKEQERQKIEAERIRKEKETLAKEKEENRRKEALLNCKLLRADQRELLAKIGYEEKKPDVWCYHENRISTAILNQHTYPVMGFEDMMSLQEAIDTFQSQIDARAKAEFEKAKREAEKKEKAGKEVLKLSGEMKEVTLDKDVNEIDVKEPFIFPNDLGVERDIEKVAEQMRKLSQLMQAELELNSEQMIKFYNNFSHALNNVALEYVEALEVITKSKAAEYDEQKEV